MHFVSAVYFINFTKPLLRNFFIIWPNHNRLILFGKIGKSMALIILYFKAAYQITLQLRNFLSACSNFAYSAIFILNVQSSLCAHHAVTIKIILKHHARLWWWRLSPPTSHAPPLSINHYEVLNFTHLLLVLWSRQRYWHIIMGERSTNVNYGQWCKVLK